MAGATSTPSPATAPPPSPPPPPFDARGLGRDIQQGAGGCRVRAGGCARRLMRVPLRVLPPAGHGEKENPFCCAPRAQGPHAQPRTSPRGSALAVSRHRHAAPRPRLGWPAPCKGWGGLGAPARSCLPGAPTCRALRRHLRRSCLCLIAAASLGIIRPEARARPTVLKAALAAHS